MKLNKLSESISNFVKSLATLAGVLLLSRLVKRPKPAHEDQELIVLGNGPSLRDLLDNHSGALVGKDLMAVNFFANTPEFHKLRPQHYVLADPHFFFGATSDPNVEGLWENLCAAEFPFTLHLPVGRKSNPPVKKFLSSAGCKQVAYFNLTPGEGWRPWRNMLYSRRLAMPRPRNVMIPAIMQAIAAGYRTVYLAGADHTWSRTLSVDENNRVVSVQPHFYTDTTSEEKRVTSEYAGYHLHDILKSLYIAFSGYHTIADFAHSMGTSIINITPGSFIDAFPRKKP